MPFTSPQIMVRDFSSKLGASARVDQSSKISQNDVDVTELEHFEVWLDASNSAIGFPRSQPFAMQAEEACEPRDVIWENVYLSAESVLRRQWVVNVAIVTLMLFWASVVSFCASSRQISDLLGYDPESQVAIMVASILPVIVLLSIINLLPLFFQLIARFYDASRRTRGRPERSGASSAFSS